jgi:hypothetical protein
MQAEAPCKAEETADAEGRKLIVLENEYLKLTVRPGTGGMVVFMLHKRSGFNYVGTAEGWFMDLDYSISQQSNNDYQKQGYVFDISENGPERVAVTLKGKSKIPPLDWIEVQKTVALERASSAISASYRYFNHPDSMEPITVRPWIHHEIGGLGPDARYFMPLTTGRYEIRPAASRSGSKYGSNPAQGWLGVVVPGGNGLAAFPSFKDIHQYYEWVSMELGTLEWRLRPLDIPNGQAYETSYLMLPLTGLRDLSGGKEGIACGIVVPDNVEQGAPVSWELELAGARAEEKLAVDARVRHLGDGVWKLLGERPCSLKPDSAVRLAFDAWTPDRPGTWVLQARVSRGGKKLFDAERTVVLAKASEGYEWALEGPRQADVNLIPDPSAEWGEDLGKGRTGAADDTVSHAGRCSVKVQPAPDPAGGPVFAQNGLPVEPTTAYVLSFWARCLKGTSLRVMTTSLGETDSRWLEWHPHFEFKNCPAEWRRYEAAFTTPERAKYLTLKIGGTGQDPAFWVDDLRMVPGQPVAVAKPAQTDIPYTTEVPTPHIPWARPYSRGPVKAFLLAHLESSRDIAELAQRLEMDFQTVTLTGSITNAAYASGTMGGRRMEDELRNIQEKLATPYEVIVLGGISWKWLPAKARVALLRQLEKGAGLVYVQPNWLLDDLVAPKQFDDPAFPKELKDADALFPLKWPGEGQFRHVRDKPIPFPVKEHAITNGIPFRALPPAQYGNWGVLGEALAMFDPNCPMITVGHYGQGRVVCLNFVSGNWPYGKDSFEDGKQFQRCGLFPWYLDEALPAFRYHYWEYFWALMARTVAWAAGKEPEVQVVAVQPDAGLQTLAQGPVETVSVKFQSEKAISGKLQATFLDETSIRLAGEERAVKLAAGEAQVFEFRTPENCPAGLIFAEFVLRDENGRSLNWAATAFENPKPVRIESITFDRESKVYRTGEKVGAKLKLSGKLEGTKLLAQVVDTYGRILQAESLDVAGEEVPVAFSLERPHAVRMALRAALFQEKRLLDRSEAWFTVTPDKSPWAQYQFIISGFRASRPYLYDHIFRIYADMGLTCVRGYHDPTINADRTFNSLASCPGFGHLKGRAHTDWSRYLQSGDLKCLYREPPAYDAEVWSQTEKSLEEYYGRRGAQFVPLMYGLADENNIGGGESDYDYSPATLEWFRKWLEAQYGTLEALNRQWETEFAAWSDVTPMTLPVARKRGENLSPWADHREFMDCLFTEYHARMKAAVRRGDPNAIVGVSGTQAPDAYNGYDWWQLMKVFDALLAYAGGNQPEIQRSFKRVPSVGWAGYGSRNPNVSSQVWQYLLYNKQVALWRDNLIIEPDWRISQSGRDYVEAVKPLLQGVGKLIIQSDWAASPVGIHYSQASIRAAAASKRASAFERARAGWVSLLKDIGLQPLFVSYEQVENGELSPDKLKAFILPESEALSDKEAEQLRKYAESGGFLIADTHAGLRDRHCRLLPEGRLDELFGIRRAATDKARPPRFVDFLDADWVQWPNKRLILSLADGAAGISATTGQALASSRDVPALICRSVGKGRTLYLNFHLTSYSGATEDGKKLRDNLRPVFSAAGVAAPCKLLEESGEPFYGCEVTLFRNGSEPLVSLLANLEHFRNMNWEKRPIVIELPEKAWVYEVVTGKSFGQTDRLACELPWNVMRILALLPGQVTGMAVTGPAEAAAGTVIKLAVQVKAEPALRDRQLVRIEAFGPDGKPRPACSTNVWIPAAGAEYEMPLALNDPPGAWRIRVTHVVTSLSAESTYEVKPANVALPASVWR